MKFICFIFLALFSISNFYSQEKQLPEFDIKKLAVIGGHNITFSDNPIWISLEDKSLDFFAIMCKIAKNKDEDIDVNKFSIVDHQNKLRYRMIDCIPLVYTASGIDGGKRYVTEIAWENKEHNVYNLRPTRERIFYNPEVHDSFEDYNLEGYQNVLHETNFGSKRKAVKAEIYYSPITYKNKMKVYFRFAVKRHHKNQLFDLYYGDEKVFEIKRKKM
jgi:hypothetical protein